MAVSTKRRAASSSASDFSPSPSPPPSTTTAKPAKKANRTSTATSLSTISKFGDIFAAAPSTSSGAAAAAALPARSHGRSYHRPLLVDDDKAVLALLQWFEGVSSKRDMPWRAAFVHDSDYADPHELREARKKRAYQVWISEIMLQQTRVETVKSYWLNWMSKWPTIEALAAAPEDQVLAAWRGLGYYSRATRIHTAAKKVVADASMDGLLPELPAELEKNVPGVGPYTAGAISSIVFGQPVPILDGNVARVLSRQLALYANAKAKQTTDLMWAAADVLVKKAFEVGGEKGTVPGEWNQALMELGSTVCTPLKPGCGECPIRSTCRAYHEAAQTDAVKPKGKKQEAMVVDLEDLCGYCEPFPFEEEAEEPRTAKAPSNGVTKLRQATLSFGFSAGAPVCKSKAKAEQDKVQLTQTMETHIRRYPMKLEKKKIRQEECLVCIVHGPKGEYLLEQRPASGLLASMWQFPSLTLSTTGTASEDSEQVFPSTPIPKLIDTFIASLIDPKATVETKDKVGSITHIFSHLHLTMHVYSISLSATADARLDKKQTKSTSKKDQQEAAGKNNNFGSKLGDTAVRRWADADEVEAETMGTGMRNCWLALQSNRKQSAGKPTASKHKK
ncbi:related to A/G-specific adenine DNA glycosylase [Sporisorium reilianum SRZ2]|uniref:Adenine DNA glycosylase n=1 Tax=Sporisorium reilianum (strain SRZ2) TaxID=999809 RepID=E6ZMW5_SPORE|nr:related to A/G-specific adenine DNA glycosylase [Sporisorium reilianum SRZ2]